jgi:hypothetical protein
MTDHEMRDVFREMRDEPVPADSLARVRAGVDQRMPRIAAWKILALMAAAVCLVAGFLILRAAKPVLKTPTVEMAQAIPVAAAEISIPPVGKAKRARRPKRVDGVPVSIRIETPDPDVVILLVN